MAGKVGILGSGVVGQSLARGFLKSGYEVMIGTRDKGKLSDWLKKAGKKASAGSFREAASFGQTLVLCCKGEAASAVINYAGRQNFSGKLVIDVTNPLHFEEAGSPPTLSVAFPGSLGATVQHLLPKSKVVKAFNTVTAKYMCRPKLKEGEPDLFIAGNDLEAKKTVMGIAKKWGWKVHDIGRIEESYLLEALTILWIRYGYMNNSWTHAFKMLKK
jgi:8-hydroxy-5-deazaflavin:NADPH oxidoreductase